MNILIVDDQSYNRDLLRYIMEDEGHFCVDAINGEDALLKLDQHNDIDIILMDVNMPKMNGIEATRQIVKKYSTQHVAIIFVTALDDSEMLSRCLNNGGDDFVPKPINESILIAKVNANYRSISNQKKLAEINAKNQREYEIIEHVFENIQSLAPTRIDNIKTYTSPMSMLNGDLVLSCASPSGGAYFLVGDFTGHGLSAAIGSLPVMSIFYNNAKRQYSVSQIAKEINAQLHKVLPTGLFLCAAIGHINQAGDQVALWSGGINDAVLFDKKTKEVILIEGDHMPLGIHNVDNFDHKIQVHNLHKNNLLYFYSDGVNEAKNQNLEIFGNEQVIDMIKNQDTDNNVSPLETIVDAVKRFTKNNNQHDDISIVEIQCTPCIHRNKHTNDILAPEKSTYKVDCFPWSLDITIAKEDLKSIDAVYQISEFLGTIPQVGLHKDKLFTIISELYNNALEHGVLGLSSEIKEHAQGFERYYQLRNQKLEQLTNEYINIRLEYIKDTENYIKIQVIDSGDGFDVANSINKNTNTALTYGRGIALIKELSSSLEYKKNGSHAIACYRFNE